MSEIILEQYPFKEDELNEISTMYLDDYPIIYILFNEKRRPEAYIGQTVQLKKRMKQHLKNKSRQKLTQSMFIGHQKFNQSATYNIETNLINYFIGDEQYKLQNVSQTRKVQMHDYYQKELYDDEIFSVLWNALRDKKLVKHSIETIRNKDIFKISPYKELSSSQLEVKEAILDFCQNNINTTENKVFMIEGDAGTGKSVVLASLYNTLQDLSKEKTSSLYKTENFLLVNHGEMIKTYHSMANVLPNLKKNHILKPTTFINKMDKLGASVDITLVDEAHLLLTKEDAYNNFKFDNQLEEIMKRSKITILIYDPKQVLKTKSYWNNNVITKLQEKFPMEVFRLEDQFRMQSSVEVVEWIDAFVSKEIKPLPTSDDDYLFKVVATGEELKQNIFDLDSNYGLSRIVSTFDYLHKKDGGTYYIDEQGLNMPWNSTDSSQTWAERSETVYEAGSIYTIQGFDLNYVGVVLGPSVDFNEETNQIEIDISAYQDTGAFISRPDLSSAEFEMVKEEIILNSINVLMKRGVNGLLIYAVNPKLRNHLMELQNNS